MHDRNFRVPTGEDFIKKAFRWPLTKKRHPKSLSATGMLRL
jgi:hypothetical protein